MGGKNPQPQQLIIGQHDWAPVDQGDGQDLAFRIQLLGGFRVEVGTRPVDDRAWRLRKARALVKLLALAPEHALHRDQLLDLLWPDLDPTAAGNNLRHMLHVARRALATALPAAGQALRWQGELLALRPDGELWVDAAAFEAAAAAARRARDPRAYEEAIALYRGDLLPEDRYEDWPATRREGLRSLYLGLLAEAARLHAARGDTAPTVALLERLVGDEPTDEEAHAALMRLYAETGQRAQALRQYERLRETLRRELDATPSAATQGLHQAILAGQFAAAPAAVAPPPPVAAPPRHNLPLALTSFVGRERERAEVGRLLGEARLVTLVGIGGAGKTRLALAVAEELVPRFADGVWLVDLASLTAPALVPHAVAAALGVREEPGRPLADTLAGTLRHKELLLVLDNCEHLIAACAELAERLLGACPGLRILATSREALRAAGEVPWRVPALAAPDPRALQSEGGDGRGLARFDAVRLFVERARAHQPGFALTAANAPDVAEICRRLDGIPLALELAAARVVLLPVKQLAARLDDALRILTSGRRTAPTRQQTLRAALDWSYALLDEAEQAVLRRLAVFAGGFGLEAAEAVGAGGAGAAGEVFQYLAQLVDKSLVQVEAGEGEGRYRLLETVRQYSLERLEQSEAAAATRRRHAAYFAVLAEEAGAGLRGPEQAAWLGRLEAELDNLRAALGWALDGADVDLGLRLAGALDRFWHGHGHLTEGRRWLERGLASQGAIPAATRAQALSVAGWLARAQGDMGRATAQLEEAVAAYRALGDEQGLVDSLDSLGDVAYFQGDYARAQALHEENLALRRTLGDPWGVAMSLNSLACVLLDRGDRVGATALLEEGLWLVREVGDRRGIAMLLYSLALVALAADEPARAAALFGESLTLFHRLGNRIDVALCLDGLAAVTAAAGDAARSARLSGAAAALEESLNVAPIFKHHRERYVIAARARLGDAAWAAAEAAGRALPLDSIIAEALGLADDSAVLPNGRASQELGQR